MDYGNYEEVDKSELQVLRKEFIKLPKQGIKCMMCGIEPINGKLTIFII